MTEKLIKLFLKDKHDTSKTARKSAGGLLSSVTGIVMNSLLCIFKFIVGITSGSAAITADAANNLSDVMSSGISFAGFKIAAKPADQKHPYGHGRYEYILSLVISFAILLMGVELLKNAVEKILHPTPVAFSPFLLVVLIGSIVVKLGLGFWNRSLSKKVDLLALGAVAKDSFADCLSTLAVLASVLIERFFSVQIDGYVAAVTALLVLWSGIEVLKDSLQPLIGKPAQKQTVEQLEKMMLSFDPAILGVHDIMMHDYGMGRVFATADVEVPAQSDLVSIHTTVDALEKQVREQFGIQLVLHIDPVDTENAALIQLQQNVLRIVKSVDEHYTVHDFRVSESDKQMSFDLVIDSDIKKDAAQIGEMVKQRIIAVLGDEIEPVITVEFPFSET